MDERNAVQVALIGTGMFGNSFLYQANAIAEITVRVVCDLDVNGAMGACLGAGISETSLTVCHSIEDAQDALDRGQIALIADGSWAGLLPVDVVLEATGSPAAGAHHAKVAIEQGKHVVMVSKEVDSVVGPILERLAAEKGVAYLLGDGDQPALLVSLIHWAEMLGLPIACAGKSSEVDFVYDGNAGSVSNGKREIAADLGDVWRLGDGVVGNAIARRGELCRELPLVSVADLCEMAMVINRTSYGFDAARLHAPIVRVPEMADVLCPVEYGGILGKGGVIDVVNCLRRPDEASLAGGVFVVVEVRDQVSWEMLRRKGHVVNRALSHAMIYRPYHLLGVETATSILRAVAADPASAGSARPKVDLCARSTEALSAGRRLEMLRDHSIPGVEAELQVAAPSGSDSPIPFYLAAGNVLTRDVSPNMLLTRGMVEIDEDSTLYKLKTLQDTVWGLHGDNS